MSLTTPVRDLLQFNIPEDPAGAPQAYTSASLHHLNIWVPPEFLLQFVDLPVPLLKAPCSCRALFSPGFEALHSLQRQGCNYTPPRPMASQQASCSQPAPRDRGHCPLLGSSLRASGLLLTWDLWRTCLQAQNILLSNMTNKSLP